MERVAVGMLLVLVLASVFFYGVYLTSISLDTGESGEYQGVGITGNVVLVGDAGENFTVVVVPSTQKYWETNAGTEMALSQSKWISDEAERRRVKAVIHIGDLVGNSGSELQWKKASQAIKVLEDVGLPVLISPGDRDVQTSGVKDYWYYSARDAPSPYFPASRFDGTGVGSLTLDNANMFSSFEIAGNKFVIVTMEHCPTEETLQKVASFVRQHGEERVILATHTFLRSDGAYSSFVGGGVCNETAGSYSTSAIWDEIVYPNPNVFLVISGNSPGEKVKFSENSAGNTVAQILIDYHGLPSGGDGYLKIITFNPERDEVYFETYSPWTGDYKTDENSQFTFHYDMASQPL